MHIPKWLIAIAGIFFLALIASLAFLVGRQTSGPSVAGRPVQTVPQASTIPAAAPGGALAPTDGPLPSPAADISRVPPEARARVEAYFMQMEAIRSGAATDDPQDFATRLVSSANSGDLSGFDDLVRAASDAERRAGALTPPPECAAYHRQAVTLLGESKTMITALRDGLKRDDTNAVASAGTSAESMKIRAEGQAAEEKALRTRFGL